MSIDINMKDAKLKKEGNWVVFDEGLETENTKLLVDDGKYNDSTQLDRLQERIAKYNDFNDIDAADKFASSIDWFTTNVLSMVGAQSASGMISSLKPALTLSLRLVGNNIGSPMVNNS